MLIRYIALIVNLPIFHKFITIINQNKPPFFSFSSSKSSIKV